MEMNDYQKKTLKEFISNNIRLIRDKEYTQIYDLLQEIDNNSGSTTDRWITQCFTEMMFKIGENPFEGMKEIYYGAGIDLSITNLIIPDSIIIIGDNAFENCKSLKNIKFSKNLKKINYGSFKYCYELQHLDIPDSVTTIEVEAFGYCYNLKSVKLGAKLEKLKEAIFYGCSNLKDLYYGGTIDDWMQLDNWMPNDLGMPEECILHCIEGDYIWNRKNQGWKENS